MTRKEYMDRAGEDGPRAHREYYAQFVTEGVRGLVARGIGTARIKASTDSHLNDIQLGQWDRLVPSLSGVDAALRAQGDYLTLGTGVCVLKEAARQIAEAVA